MKHAHLLRSLISRRCDVRDKYVSLIEISAALHLGMFDQPIRKERCLRGILDSDVRRVFGNRSSRSVLRQAQDDGTVMVSLSNHALAVKRALERSTGGASVRRRYHDMRILTGEQPPVATKSSM